MSATKTNRECYEIRNNGEWANIALACWQRGPTDTCFAGEIMIHSSFGSWAYTWTACAVPFKRFLCGIGFDYAFGKFMGMALDKFDGEATLAQIKRDILKSRRSGELTVAQAASAWDAVMDEDEQIAGNDATAYGHAMWDIGKAIGRNHPMADYFNDPCGWPRVTRYDSQAVGFWRDIWPAFVDALRAEMQEATPA